MGGSDQVVILNNSNYQVTDVNPEYIDSARTSVSIDKSQKQSPRRTTGGITVA